jgi:hypothetical protein
MTSPELTWKRNTQATRTYWLANDGPGVIYAVYKNTDAYRGRQWVVEQWPIQDEAHPKQATGFSTRELAQAAAVNRSCIKCERRLHLKDVHRNTLAPATSHPSWLCNDTDACKKAKAEKDEQWERERVEQLKRNDHNHIEIREGEFGPDLAIGNVWVNERTGREDGHTTVLSLTENDLARIERIIHDHGQAHGPGAAPGQGGIIYQHTWL